jgi:glutathione synthase/RimK-type ligase-like ATP-grasp enzyme
MQNNVYIYYSGATDKTGNALAEALDISKGRTAPKGTKKVVIGWGAKTDKAINLGTAKVLNHPDAIRVNRNKLKALELMQNAKVKVAPFVAAENVNAALDNAKSGVALPVIGRTNYHQGGANFFTCLTRTHVNDVIKALNNKLKKKGYFQNYIDVVDEYRLHIVNDELIYAVRKKERSNLAQAHVEQQSDKIERMAEKQGKTLDKETLEYALDYQGKKIAGADNIVRSNTRGWKFSNVKLENVPKPLITEAVKAIKALGLDFGAVDCVMDAEKQPWIIEVNTGPGLEGTPFTKYVEAFNKAINDILAPPAKKATQTKAAATKVTAKKADTGRKLDPEKLRMLADMMDNCDDDAERDAVNKVAQRMFG